ncbi:hypothetical protein ACFWM7_26880 [Streptomyces sp. NPDC058375]
MDADAAGSGTHPYAGPLGRNPEAASEKITPSAASAPPRPSTRPAG